MAECPVTDYARAVASGSILAAALVHRACQRHLSDLETGPARGLTWDSRAAWNVIEFFSLLRHSKGEFAGKPFLLTPWQQFAVGSIYGWKRRDGTRRYRRAGIWISKKNGKSSLASALVIHGLIGDGEAGAHVYGAAADRNQASIIYEEAASMVRQAKFLRERLRVLDTTKRIVFDRGNGFYSVLSKDSRKYGHGINASLCVIDEMHVVDREMYDTLRYAGAARRQPLLVEISTAGNDRDSIGYERYTYARRLLLGEIEDDETFSFIAEADSNDAWQEPEQWRKANPSMGVTITQESFEGDFKEALNSPPASQANFKQLRLNLWQDSIHQWIPLERWDACAGELPDLDGVPCWGGLDLSAKMDLTAWVMCYQVDDEFWLVPKFWAPKEGEIRRHGENRTLLRPWMERGLIRGIEGDCIDPDEIEKQVIADCEQYGVNEVAIDEWNALSVMVHLQAAFVKLVPFGQTLKNYNEPMKEFERLVYEGKIRHDGNPVLRWCVANTVVYKDANGNVRPDKKNSGDRIDGVSASVMAFARAMLAGMQWSTSYDSPGSLAI